MNIDKVTMVQCLVLVSALLLASVWASVDCQLGIIVHKCRQRRPVNVCATALRSVGIKTNRVSYYALHLYW